MEKIKIKLINNDSSPITIENKVILKARTPKLISIGQHQLVEIALGVEIEPPSGFELKITPIDRLIKKSISARLTLGSTSNKYELVAILHNMSNEPFHIHPFDPIVRLILTPVIELDINYISNN